MDEFDAWDNDDNDAAETKQNANAHRHRAIRWRSRAAFLRWLLELLRRGGRVTSLVAHTAPQLHGEPRDTWARGEEKQRGRRKSRPRKPGETEAERVRRLAAERARRYRAGKKGRTT